MSETVLPTTVIEKRWLQRVTLSIAPAPLPRGAVLKVGGTPLPWTPAGPSGAAFTLPEELIAQGDTTAEFVGADGAKLSSPCPLPIGFWVSFGTLVGFIDHVERLRGQVTVRGWAVDWRKPRQRVQVGLEVEGRIVALARADIYRADLKQLGVGDGHQGFAFCILGSALHDDEEVVVRLMANGAPLDGSPVRLGGGHDKTGGATVVGRLHTPQQAEAGDTAAEDIELPPDLVPVALPPALAGQDAELGALLARAAQDHPQAYLLLQESGTTLPPAQAVRLAATLRANACAGFAVAVTTMPDGMVVGGGYRMVGDGEADGIAAIRPPPEFDLLVAEIGSPGVVAFPAQVLLAALQDCGAWQEGRPGSIWSELAVALLARGLVGLLDPAVRAVAPYRHPKDRGPPAVSPAFGAAFRPVRPRRRPQRLVELSAATGLGPGLGLAWQTLGEILLRRAVVWALLDHRPVVVLDPAAPAALFRRLRGHGLEVLEAPLPDGLDAAEQPLRHRLQQPGQQPSATGRGPMLQDLVLQDVVAGEEPAGPGTISLRTHPLAMLPPPDAALTAALLRAQMLPIAPAREPALWRGRGSNGEDRLDRMIAAQLALESGADEAADDLQGWLRELAQPEDVGLETLRATRHPQACAERLQAELRQLGF
ncbi:hypothetical protein HB662_28210 [Roseomonas frigidaquae]|uniref:Uncharacterized protein n=1 Tax=Falsiroseomonas frigidaquae TaxID=487318 RepID=A0ABX1F8R0_9PROT|nr:hypothetical protein [Falsiroseomonas frigidaquae]NKE48682.1 hypothetical protein [Falsiroseomonas frigidaquae]